MRITASDLLENHIIDDIVTEPLGGAHKDPSSAAQLLKTYIIEKLDELGAMSTDVLVDKRYERFRKYGSFYEN